MLSQLTSPTIGGLSTFVAAVETTMKVKIRDIRGCPDLPAMRAGPMPSPHCAQLDSSTQLSSAPAAAGWLLEAS